VLWSQAWIPELSLEESDVWVSEEGNTVFVAEIAGIRGAAIQRSGQATQLLNVPLGPPDALGWVPIGDETFWGVQNMVTGELRSTSLPSIAGHRPFAWRNRVIHLAADVHANVVTVVGADVSRLFAIPPIDVAVANLVPTEFGAVLTERGMPRAVLNAETLELRDLGVLPREGNFDVLLHQAGEWGLVVEGQIPRYVVNLRTGFVTGLTSERSPEQRGVMRVRMNERWAVVADPAGVPLFRVNLPGGTLDRLDFRQLAPLRPFGSPCSAPSTMPGLLDDGTLVVALQNAIGVQAYVGQPNAFPWSPVGAPASWVVAFGTDLRSDSWILDATSGVGTSCQGVNWPNDPPEGTLVDDSVQIILDNGGLLFPFHQKSEFIFHESGLCAFVRGYVHDFPTGFQIPLPADATNVMFW
jgi:hypothetical protein